MCPERRTVVTLVKLIKKSCIPTWQGLTQAAHAQTVVALKAFTLLHELLLVYILVIVDS